MIPLDSVRMGLAVAMSTAGLWVVCTALVLVAPGPAMVATGGMVHAELDATAWVVTASGFASGLLVWSLGAGLFAATVSQIYNRLVARAKP